MNFCRVESSSFLIWNVFCFVSFLPALDAEQRKGRDLSIQSMDFQFSFSHSASLLLSGPLQIIFSELVLFSLLHNVGEGREAGLGKEKVGLLCHYY